MCSVNWSGLRFMSIYFSMIVFVMVGGQSTTEDDKDDMFRHLVSEVFNLKTQLANALAEIATLKPRQSTNMPAANEKVQVGSSYVRWGRKTCNGNATRVYRGYGAGAQHNTGGGGGSNFLCLPEEPQWKTYLNGDQTSGLIVGMEYELFNSGSGHNNIFSERNNGGSPLLDNPAPCSVCYVGGRSTVLMIPAKTQCPDGWTTEYSGYLVSAHSSGHTTTEYVCLDEAPEVAVGGTAQNPAVIYPVEVTCGSLPCSVYISGRELTCVVCSK